MSLSLKSENGVGVGVSGPWRAPALAPKDGSLIIALAIDFSEITLMRWSIKWRYWISHNGDRQHTNFERISAGWIFAPVDTPDWDRHRSIRPGSED